MRYSDFNTITRSNTQVPATRDAALLAARAVALIDRTNAGQRPVRLLGVSVHNLCEDPGAQGSRAGTPWLPLFSEDAGGPRSEESAWDQLPEADS
jgi:impB/mucB/samB family C-terminal domain